MANITRRIDTNVLLAGVVGSSLLRVNIVIRDGSDGLSPGFSITGDVWEARGRQSGAYRMRRGWDMDMGGCIHDVIAEHLPQLAPVIAVHLADLDGTPMHAVANGWYFYSGDARRWEESRGESYHNRDNLTDAQRAARALSIDVADLPEGMNKAAFVAFADGLGDRWATMAADARALIMALPE